MIQGNKDIWQLCKKCDFNGRCISQNEKIPCNRVRKESEVNFYIVDFPEISLKVDTTDLDVIVKAELKIEPYKIFTSQDKLGINFKNNQAIINEMKKHVLKGVLQQYINELLQRNKIDLELI